MNEKPSRFSEIIVIAIAVPILGILLGGIYSYPAMRLTKERDPWLTILLGVGLAITVFGIGYAATARFKYLAAVWLVSIVLLLLARAAYGSLGHSFERFGIVHMVTVAILLWVLLLTRNPKPTSPNHALQRTATAVTARASAAAFPPTMHGPRQPPPSLSLRSLAHFHTP